MINVSSGECCNSVICEPAEVCVYNGSMYEVGSPIPTLPPSCCRCKITLNTSTRQAIECKPFVCQENCPLGFTYRNENEQCCGNCVQTSCILNNTTLIAPGELWQPPDDNCTFYDCEPNTLMIIKRIMSCTEQPPMPCEEGVLTDVESADGCCKMQICIEIGPSQDQCEVKKSLQIIEYGGCSASLYLAHCEGPCNSLTRYSTFSKVMEHDCSCCQETSISMKNVQLQCTNGTTVEYKYHDVEQCGCQTTACVTVE
ncbi:intestinal mucin-like protein [Rhinophrynus dorsalis]